MRILHCAIETSTYSVSYHKCQTYRSILQPCCRFKIIEFSGKLLLYKHPIDALPKSTFNGKIKVSVQKVTAAFGSASGLAINIAQYADRNWRSAWLILSPQEYSWFIFGRVYRKKQIKPQVIKVPDDSQDQKMVAEAATWIKNNDRNLKYSDREILLGESTWLNDNLLDSAQKLIRKSLGNLASWQSVLNWQRRGTPFYKVGEEHLQLMHDGINHCFFSFNSDGRVQVCDSLYKTHGSVTKRCLKVLDKSLLDEDGKLSVTMIPVQKQKDFFFYLDFLSRTLQDCRWSGRAFL